MKSLCLLAALTTLALLSAHTTDLNNETVVIKYYTKNVELYSIENALKTWEVAGLTFQKTNKQEAADLVLSHVNSNQMYNPINYGEHMNGNIAINNKYKFTDAELKSLVAHEVGHFLGLPHNSEPYSIMNDNTPLRVRRITQCDLSRLKKIKHSLILKLYLKRILKFSVEKLS